MRTGLPGLLSYLTLAACAAVVPAGESVRGTYVEARTCQVYTGPCFANGEVGSAGKHAILTWQIEDGSFAGIDLSGRSVSVILKASHTLGFQGLDNATTKKALVIIDAAASGAEAAALKAFALARVRMSDANVAGVQRAEITMDFNAAKLTATVDVAGVAHLKTRKARHGDCICSNESAYYPPLTELTGFVPGVTIEGEVTARRLGSRWSIPDSRTAYLGRFEVTDEDVRVAGSL